MSLEIKQISLLSDNYAYLIRDTSSATTAVIDPSEAPPVAATIERSGGKLDYILNTHHHHDHTGGNGALKQRYGAKIIAGKGDANKIDGIDKALTDGQEFELGQSRCRILETPGHTKGHIVFWFYQDQALFTGDTLFSLGCGRLFEGDANQMWQSLSKLLALPDSTRIYCAHEYTAANIKFALSVAPSDAVKSKESSVTKLRAQRLPTVPSSLAEEKNLNPFLRAADPMLAEAIGLSGKKPQEIFARLRQLKDNF